jgi:hypothetical protein
MLLLMNYILPPKLLYFLTLDYKVIIPLPRTQTMCELNDLNSFRLKDLLQVGSQSTVEGTSTWLILPSLQQRHLAILCAYVSLDSRLWR